MRGGLKRYFNEGLSAKANSSFPALTRLRRKVYKTCGQNPILLHRPPGFLCDFFKEYSLLITSTSLSPAEQIEIFNRSIDIGEKYYRDPDGRPLLRQRAGRPYICHALEVTAVYQLYKEICWWRQGNNPSRHLLDFRKAVEEIVKFAEAISVLNPEPLKNIVRTAAGRPWIDEPAMVVQTCLPIHDIKEIKVRQIKQEWEKKNPLVARMDILNFLRAMRDEINSIYPGSGEMTFWLTDKWERTGNEEKRKEQRKWGASRPKDWFDFSARNCKAIDFICNLADLHLVPEQGRWQEGQFIKGRMLKQKAEYAKEMLDWMKSAQGVDPILKAAFYQLYFKYDFANGIKYLPGERIYIKLNAKLECRVAAFRYPRLKKRYVYERYQRPLDPIRAWTPHTSAARPAALAI